MFLFLFFFFLPRRYLRFRSEKYVFNENSWHVRDTWKNIIPQFGGASFSLAREIFKPMKWQQLIYEITHKMNVRNK